jgi:putative transposase
MRDWADQPTTRRENRSMTTHRYSQPSWVLMLVGRKASRPRVAEAVRAIDVTQFTYYRWRKECGGLKTDQVKRLKELERENERLRKAVSDLTLEKLILREAASGNF